MSLLHMPTPRITAPTRVCRLLDGKPKLLAKTYSNHGEYMRDYKVKYPERYALMQRITSVRKSIRHYTKLEKWEKVSEFSAELATLYAKRKVLNRG